MSKAEPITIKVLKRIFISFVRLRHAHVAPAPPFLDIWLIAA